MNLLHHTLAFLGAKFPAMARFAKPLLIPLLPRMKREKVALPPVLVQREGADGQVEQILVDRSVVFAQA
ncbi:MAG: hypothetical protein ACRCWO_01705, partial [Bosea sp. (in: a-proteobacteria)]